jgi:hypothetical protein
VRRQRVLRAASLLARLRRVWSGRVGCSPHLPLLYYLQYHALLVSERLSEQCRCFCVGRRKTETALMFTSRCVCACNCAYTCASVLKLGTGIYTRRFGRQVHDYSRDNGGSTSVLAPGLTLWMTYLLICKKEACPSQAEVCTSWRCETTKFSTGNLRLRTTCPCCSSFFGSVICHDIYSLRLFFICV